MESKNLRGFTTPQILIFILALAVVVGAYFVTMKNLVGDDWSVQWKQMCESTGGEWLSNALPSGNPCKCGNGRYFDVASTGCISSATPSNETANWQIYTNSQYGFEVKYPQNLVAMESRSGSAVNSNIMYITNPNQGKPDTDQPTDRLTIIIDENTNCVSKDWAVGFGGINRKTACIENNTHYSVIMSALNQESQNVLDEILSTFKFISPNVLTQKIAEDLVKNNWLWCEGMNVNCLKTKVSIENREGIWYVISISSGLGDDSVAAEKRIARAIFGNGVWSLDKPIISFSCVPNRGHQDFSTENCY
jgi:hypothetical protein